MQTAITFGEQRSNYDAVVIGAGPAGCASAACLSAGGATVLLLESNPRAARRFAGEWVHPEGARVLDTNDLLTGLETRSKTHGFVVFPNDGLGAIRLEYPGSATGFTCEHETLVGHLRSRVSVFPRVDYLEGVRAHVVDRQAVDLSCRGRATQRVNTRGVVVAAGRSAHKVASGRAVRGGQISISSMAGLIVRDRELPFDGYGHVFVGGPGPVLAYRIDERRIRLCIDVPAAMCRSVGSPEWIWQSYAEALPRSLRSGVRDALDAGSISWATNAFRPRSYRMNPDVALIGDAAGVFHPLTAMGITMSLLDAEALAESRSLSEYARRRSAQSYIPELLSNAIYQAFARTDTGSQAIRDSIYGSWRASAAQRNRTMNLLGAASTSRADFFSAFLRVALRASASSLVSERRTLAELAGWLKWPWASLHPQPAEIRSRSLSWAAPESWARRDFARYPQHLEENTHAN